MMKRLLAAGVLLILCAVPGMAGQDPLASGFIQPPDAARPGVWWRWIDGNISKEGVTRDLEEMARGGIRSAEIFDVAGAPQVGKAGMMDPLWRELFRHAVEEAARDGIKLGVVPAAGWGTGGPWIGPEDAARVLRHTEIQVDGPSRLAAVLPAVPKVNGYYKDVAVVAWREPPGRPIQPAEVTANSVVSGYCGEQNWPAADVVDGDPNTYWRSNRAPSSTNPVWIDLHYHQPLEANGLFIAGSKGGGPQTCQLQAPDDSGQFHTISRFEMEKGVTRRFTFAPITSRSFRLLITSAHTPDVQLAEAWLLRAGDEPRLRPGIKWWWFKSGNRSFWDWPKEGPAVMDTEYQGQDTADCRHAEVVDLGSRMTTGGKLEWEVPPGRWTIAHFGVTLLGEAPRMMSRALQGGYEADPFSPKAADRMWDSTVQVLAKENGEQVGKALAGILVDSWEYGASSQGFQPTWTDEFRSQFRRRRGYDLIPWLPALARRVVDGRQMTDRFLWDYRQTLADLYLDFYARLTERAHRMGMYSRAENGYGTYPFQHIDGLAAFARVDLPMGEFWFRDPVMTQHYHFADSVRTAASSAHIYGRRLVSAESLTVGHGIWQTPEDYKPDLDAAFCDGLNNSMLHLWSEQYDPAARPGLDTYDLINANMTWWRQGRAFLSYIARCQYLLQQGLSAADACYFTGEGDCKFVPGRAFTNPSLPAGYEFDGINAEVILNRLSCKNGRLVLPDGMSYRYLVLPPTPGWTVTPPVLRKIRALVQVGATIVGPRPGHSPGLTDYPRADQEAARVAEVLWGKNPASQGARKIGRGRVIWGQSMKAVLAADRMKPDFEIDTGESTRAGLWGARWIWHGGDGNNPPPGVRLFRTSLEIPMNRKVVSAWVSLTADNTFELRVNGTQVCRGDNWQKVIDASLGRSLHPGQNEILVRAANTGAAPNPAGLIAKMVVFLDNGVRLLRTTGDKTWQSSGGDGRWAPAVVVGPLGCAPWGMVEPGGPSIYWTHRSTGQAEIYFLANQNNRAERLECRFRVSGKQPEIWDPVTGGMEPAPVFRQADGGTTVPLQFPSHGSLFVVFRRPIAGNAAGGRSRNFPELIQAQVLNGAWTVKFDPRWGGPESVVFQQLVDWTSRPEEGIKYYSGTVTYLKQFDLAESSGLSTMLPRPLLAPKLSLSGGQRTLSPNRTRPGRKAQGTRLFLYLGTVKNIAEVRLNGKDLGVVWCAPWQVEIPPGLLREKGNKLKIQAANLWQNRLIGDARVPPARRLTRTNVNLSPDSPLLESGLLGPVTIETQRT